MGKACLSLCLVVLLAMAGGRLTAQNNRLHVQPAPTAQRHLLPSPTLLPAHIRSNPQGHAPLCRMETRIERRAPVGVWMRLDGPLPSQGVNAGWANLRFRVPLR